MNIMNKTVQWFNPVWHIVVASGISMLTAIIAFRSTELDRKTIVTFFAFYLILGAMAALFAFRNSLTNPKTRQLLQFSYFLMGFVLMITGILGMISGNFRMASVFLLMLFLPGLAAMRAGLHFKRDED